MNPDELLALRVEMAALCGWRVVHDQYAHTGPRYVAGDPLTYLHSPHGRMVGVYLSGHVGLSAFAYTCHDDSNLSYDETIPDYPHDIAAAWQVVEAMGARGYSFSIQSPGSHDTGDGHYKFKRWQASFWGASVFDEHTNPPLKDGVDTAPLAICLAARAALRGHDDGI